MSPEELDAIERIVSVSGSVSNTKIVAPLIDALRNERADNARLREAIRQHREDTGEHMNLVDVHLYDVLKEGK